MWDFLLVTLARLVVFASKPIFDRLERRTLRKLRARTVSMEPLPIADVPLRQRVKIDGLVEPAGRGAAFFVRDAAGDRALVQPASAAAIWCLRDGEHCTLGAGDRVAVVGVARAADPRIDREIADHARQLADRPREIADRQPAADERVARLVFAGSEADPLYVTRLIPAP